MNMTKLKFFLCIFLCFISYKIHAKQILWFTGLPCSGKTTIAKHFTQQCKNCIHLDGDEVRATLNADLGFTPEDRRENLRRISELCILLAKKTDTVIVTTISPRKAFREEVRKKIENAEIPFFEIYIKADLNTCIKRDVKGMYKKAIAGEIKFFTGIGAPYEIPKSPHLICNTDQETIDESVSKLLTFIKG